MEAIHTYCGLCVSHCGMLCYVEDGKLVKTEPDRSHPNGHSICPKGLAAPQLVYNSQRLRHPIKRTRPKGDADPGWVEISWEEAYQQIADNILKVKSAYGPEAIAFYRPAKAGSPSSDYEPWVIRLASALGTPNTMSTGYICQWHRDTGSAYTYGTGIPAPDLDQTKCLLIWGFNPYRTWNSFYENLKRARKRGITLIVIDPRRTEIAAKADYWLQVRPGTDGALALIIINVMISERLFDQDFVRDWTNAPFLMDTSDGTILRDANGCFYLWDDNCGEVVKYDSKTITYTRDSQKDAEVKSALEVRRNLTVNGRTCQTVWQSFSKLAAKYPPERGAEITTVPADLIRLVARTITGTKPFSYFTYNGIEQHSNAMQTNRAITTLYSLTGNLQQPGGNVSFPGPKTNDVQGREMLTREQVNKRLGLAEHPLGAAPSGRVRANDFYEAVLHEKPYPVKALLSFGGNLVQANSNSLLGREAIKKLDFYMQTELFMTPMAELADIVLPVSTVFEDWYVRDGFGSFCPRLKNHIQYRPAVIKSLYDTKSDPHIIFELAQKLGFGNFFWNRDLEAAFNYYLQPSGITVEELKKHPTGLSIPREIKYAQYRENGFKTPTKKVEIYSLKFAQHGYLPFPDYEEPKLSPKANQNLAREYPMILTNAKLRFFLHGQHRAVPNLRKMVPHPFLEINRTTAVSYDVKEDDWVYLETPLGRIKLKVHVTDGIAPGVVITQHGWWQSCPELGLPGYDPFSTEGANINSIIDNKYMDEISGSISHKSYLCKIVKIR